MPAFRPVLERFVEKFELNTATGCWDWTASKSTKGYGKFQHHRHGKSSCWDAHRVSFEIFIGDVPAGMEVHHRCGNRGCVNPNHLEPMPHKSNCDWSARKQDSPNTVRTYLLNVSEDTSWQEPYRIERERKRLAKNAKITGRPPKPLLERIAEQGQVNWETDCWEWTGYTENRPGMGHYARVKVRGNKTPVGVHIVMYQIFNGEIPEGITVDHICRNSRCFYPKHLRLLTRSANSDGGWVKAMREKTHCAKNHPLSGDNLFTRHLKNGGTARGCKQCRRDSNARQRTKHK